MVKKIFGFLFIVVAAIFVLGLLGNMVKILTSLLNIFKIFNGTMTADEIGYTIGYFISWSIMIFLIVMLLRVGLRWIKSPKKIIDGEHLPLDSNFKV